MKKTVLRIGEREVAVLEEGRPETLLLQPVDAHDAEGLEAEAACLAAQTERAFALCGVRVADWNRELSPWEAPPVFGREGFAGGAAATLAEIEDTVLPALLARWDLPEETETFLGGYSLAGLFALWCGYAEGRFAGIAAASPSVWFPGWIDFAEKNRFYPRCAALSLGDREERTRNPVMAKVADCIRAQQAIFASAGVASSLVWNPGNHFREPEIRTANAFAEVLRLQRFGK